MGVFDSLLTGYATRRREIEAENVRRAEAAADRENAAFTALLNSPDRELASMAAIGLMQGTQPQKPKGGLRGWFGEMEANPAYPKVLEYMRTPKVVGHEEVFSPRVPARFRFPTQ